MKGKKYTIEEINSSINKLEVRLEQFILDRKAINQSIKHIRGQIKYWRELDDSQYKLFSDDS